MRTLLLTLLALGTLAADEDPGRKDRETMQGDWAAVSMVSDGYRLPDDDAQALFRSIQGDRYTVFRFDKAVGKGTFTLDATKKPRAIDAVPETPAGKGKPMRGIYRIDGDKLELCFATAGKERPAAFESKEGSGHTLSVWTREKGQR
jgi:uncharacterized protein (TIGR03067 family)